MKKKKDDIIYLVNNRDEIYFVNREYEEFASANSGLEVASKAVLHRSLWNFITDLTTQELYRNALKLVRDGSLVRFKFRCDSPNCRRLMEMHLRCIKDMSVEFRVRTVSEKRRPAQALWDPLTVRAKDLLHVCSWCKKIQVGGTWLEVEKAVSRLHLFERKYLPSVSHGICGHCYREMSDILAAS